MNLFSTCALTQFCFNVSNVNANPSYLNCSLVLLYFTGYKQYNADINICMYFNRIHSTLNAELYETSD